MGSYEPIFGIYVQPSGSENQFQSAFEEYARQQESSDQPNVTVIPLEGGINDKRPNEYMGREGDKRFFRKRAHHEYEARQEAENLLNSVIDRMDCSIDHLGVQRCPLQPGDFIVRTNHSDDESPVECAVQDVRPGGILLDRTDPDHNKFVGPDPGKAIIPWSTIHQNWLSVYRQNGNQESHFPANDLERLTFDNFAVDVTFSDHEPDLFSPEYDDPYPPYQNLIDQRINPNGQTVHTGVITARNEQRAQQIYRSILDHPDHVGHNKPQIQSMNVRCNLTEQSGHMDDPNESSTVTETIQNGFSSWFGQ